MIISFFKTDCRESPRREALIGICDDQNGERAYTDILDANKWIAIIKNVNNVPITFTAIDNCLIILKDGTKDQESTCDGMLTFKNGLYLVELKNQGTGGWITTAIRQLENTIKLLLENHALKDFKYKKAYACNKKHPRFVHIDNERNKRFYKKYGFRLDVQAQIVLK